MPSICITGGGAMTNVELFEKLHFITTLIFGIVLTVTFLGLQKQKASWFKIGLFIITLLVLIA